MVAVSSGAVQGLVGKISTAPPASNGRMRACTRRRNARPGAAMAGSVALAARKRSRTPGPRRGRAVSIQPPSEAQASSACTVRKWSKKLSIPSGARLTPTARPRRCSSFSSAGRRASATSGSALIQASWKRSSGPPTDCRPPGSSASPTPASTAPLRANQPQVSKLGANWQAPARLTAPKVGRKPNRPQ